MRLFCRRLEKEVMRSNSRSAGCIRTGGPELWDDISLCGAIRQPLNNNIAYTAGYIANCNHTLTRVQHCPAVWPAVNLDSIRRTLSSSGHAVARLAADSGGWRHEETAIQLGRLVEGSELEAIQVGLPQAWPEPLAYLDGVQHSEIVGYVRSSPIIVAEISAAVRERRGRRLRTVVEERRHLALARSHALAAAARALATLELVPLPEEEPAHPGRDLLLAARSVDQRRGALELEVGDRYRSSSDGWLLVDGSLSESPRWAADPRTFGICRSHSVLPFEGNELDRYLRLPPGYRSSIYEPASRARAPVRAWALRLWPWEGRDLLHGLVRIEAAPTQTSSESADQISRWLLAERAPVCAPDRRWDRLLYGIHSVEQYLQTRAF
jgi:hypothetical protein